MVASRRARKNTARSIARVNFPVNVFCWLGWKVSLRPSPQTEEGEAVPEPE